MIDIIEIKKTKTKAQIITSNRLIKNINLEALFKFNISVGEIEESVFNEFLLESEKLNAKAYIINLLSRMSKTEKEARTKLYQKGYGRIAIKYAMDFALKYNYINDENYAEIFVAEGLNTKGKFRLRQEMKIKGIDNEIIENVLENIEDGKEENSATQLAERYMKNKEYTQKNYERLYRHLISRGFDYDTIKKAVSPFYPIDFD